MYGRRINSPIKRKNRFLSIGRENKFTSLIGDQSENKILNQFKDLFLDNEKGKFSRVVNSQRCLRVSGKHNDLDEVGHDTYHHTMFEMLGNWSFGDYFKKDAILWSWEFLTNILKIDKDRLYITIFSHTVNELANPI